MCFVALAIQAAGSLDGPSIRDQMFSVSSGGMQYGPAQYVEAAAAARRGEDLDHQGASGDVDFDQNGDVQAGWDVWVVSDGQIISTETDVPPN